MVPTPKMGLSAGSYVVNCIVLNTQATTKTKRPQAQAQCMCNKNHVTVKHHKVEKHGCEKAAKLLRSLEEDSECIKPWQIIYFFPLASSRTSMTTGR